VGLEVGRFGAAGYAPRYEALGPGRGGGGYSGVAALKGACCGSGQPPGWLHGPLKSVSRFLKFPILNCEKGFRIWTSTPTPRAQLCTTPGGYL
jgi:hypothetical protein